MDGKQFHTRARLVGAVLAALLLLFFGVLYNANPSSVGGELPDAARLFYKAE